MEMLIIPASLLITSVMSYSGIIIEGALICVGEEHKKFLLIFTSHFLFFYLLL